MITTRARPGRLSVIALRILEQGGEVAGRESGRRSLEALHGPRPEIEVQRARGVLDRAPPGPSVLARQAEQPGPGRLAPPRRAVIGGHQLLQDLHRQTALAPDVAELEAGVVVARVLVVDQPDAVAVVDKVRGQQVVVTRDGAAPVRGSQGGPGRLEPRQQVVVAVRDPEPSAPY